MKSMKPTHHKELDHSKGFLQVELSGGNNDGEIFRIVEVFFTDDAPKEFQGRALWVSNARPGYFRSVFVPWDEVIQGAIDGMPALPSKRVSVVLPDGERVPVINGPFEWFCKVCKKTWKSDRMEEKCPHCGL